MCVREVDKKAHYPNLETKRKARVIRYRRTRMRGHKGSIRIERQMFDSKSSSLCIKNVRKTQTTLVSFRRRHGRKIVEGAFEFSGYTGKVDRAKVARG